MSEEDFLKKVGEILKDKAKSTLILSDPKNLNSGYVSLVKMLVTEKKLEGIILNFKNPSIKEKESFTKNGMDTSGVSFIDGVTVAADFFSKDSDIFLLLNPKDIDGIKPGIDSMLSKNKKTKFIIVDLLDVLLYYNSIEKIEDMIEYLQVSSSDNEIFLFVFANKENKILLDKINPLFEEKIDI